MRAPCPKERRFAATRSTDARTALTLIELLVVLTILAILTTLTITLTDSTVEQARFDATQRQLQAIQDAILGPAGRPDAPSFVGDTGRLPLGHLVPTGEVQPVELWANPASLPAFGSYTATVDGAGTALPTPVPGVLAGWRGQYLSLPPGQSRLLDGWGNPFGMLQPDGLTPAADGATIGQCHSAGGPNAPYNVVQFVPANTVTTGTGVSTFAWSAATVSGSVANPSTMGTSPMNDITVRLFVPDVSKTPPVRVMTCNTKATNAYAFKFPVPVDTFNPAPDADSQLPVPVGVKALQVYQAGAVVGPVFYLNVPAGGLTRSFYCNIN